MTFLFQMKRTSMGLTLTVFKSRLHHGGPRTPGQMNSVIKRVKCCPQTKCLGEVDSGHNSMEVFSMLLLTGKMARWLGVVCSPPSLFPLLAPAQL